MTPARGGTAAAAMAAALAGAGASFAAEPPTTSPVVVVAPTPFGAGDDPDRLPFATTTLDGEALAGRAGPALLRGLDRSLGAVSLDEAQGSAFQPSLIYRGFEASPLVGSAQGLAVYVNGTRFNQPFGDTVDWDLIPDVAIDTLALTGSDPDFGLNALAGALSVRLKDGLGAPFAGLSVSGGSFGRLQGAAEARARAGDTGLYLAASGLADRGWRAHSPSHLGQLYGDFGWRRGPLEAHLWGAAAQTALTGQGTTPVELLAADRRAVFTRPDETRNRSFRLGGALDYAVSPRTSLSARAYLARLDQASENGDAAEVEPCDANRNVLCVEDGPPLVALGGGPVANFVTGTGLPGFRRGGPYGLLNRTRTGSTSAGVAGQAASTVPLAGRPNRLEAGLSFDAAAMRFSADALVGALSGDRAWTGPGVALDLPDGSIAPVHARIVRRDVGLYAADTWQPAKGLAVTASARFDAASLTLTDLRGTALNGRHRYGRLNPALGATYAVTSGVTLYGGYSRSSRTPTPAELACASPDAPCSLTNFFVADPDLKAPRAGTVEAGVRGTGRGLAWRLGLFRADVADDIQMVASEVVGRAYFANVGATRREGVEAEASLTLGPVSARASYAHVAATYRAALRLDPGENPAVPEGEAMAVRPGDRIPGVPADSLKLSLDYAATPALSLGLDAKAQSGRYLQGDEANLNPPTPGFVVFDARASVKLTPRLTLFGEVDNLLDARYATFGGFSPTSLVPILEVPGASDPRSLSPGAPRAAYVGLKLSL